MSTNRKIQKVLVALIVGMLCAAPVWGFAQAEKGVTRVGESTKATKTSPTKPYVNEFGKLVCWPRVNSNGKLLTYGPIADTEDADEITATTANLHGNILHDGWCNPAGVTTQGFEISTSADFTSIVKTVTLSPTPTFTPCATYPTCSCNDNKYSQTVTDLLPGTTYYYRAYATNTCGTGYGDTVEFKTKEDYQVVVTGPNAYEFCITGSESATYTATTNPVISSGSKTYKWYVDGTEVRTLVSDATSDTYTRTYTQADAGNHTVKCEISVVGLTHDGSVTTAITVLNPTVNYTGITGNTTVCYGESTTLTANATATPTDAALSYQWKKDGSEIPDATNASYTTGELFANATYTCEITATEDDCPSATSSKTVNVTVNNPRVLSASVAPATTVVCAGNPFTLTATASASTGATLSYQWQKDGVDISGATSATYTVTPTSPTSDIYTCVVTATQGSCTKSQETDGVTVNVIEAAYVGTITVANQTICINSHATLTATVSDNVGNLHYQWKKGTENVGTDSPTYETPNLTTTTTYTVYVTASNDACSATDSKTVTVTVLNPTVTFSSLTGPEGVCDGQTATLTANASTTSPFTLLYSWNNGAFGTSNTKSYTLTGTGSRTFTCKVQAINLSPACASDPVEKTITVNIYNPSISDASIYPSTQAICAGNSTTLTAHATVNPAAATVSYQWKKDGANISGATSSTYNATEAGTYTCVITATQGGCSKSATTTAATVTVSDPNVGTLSVNNSVICSGETATLTATVTGNTGNLTYQWSTGGANISGATGYTLTVTPTTTTTYTVNVTATVGTCTATANASTTVKIDGPYEKFDTLEVCDCQLPYTYNKNGWNVTWTAADLTSGNETRTRHLYTAAAHCDSILHITLETWSATNTVSTSCHNVVANAYGNETVVGGELTKITDADGNDYTVVQIGDQCWMKENLRVKQFADGRPLHASHSVSDGYLTNIYYTPASGDVRTKNVCDHVDYIPYDENYEKQYGLFYNWNTAMDNANPGDNLHNVQGICPNGWHLPDTAEWQTLERAAGFYGQHSETDHVFVGTSAIHLVTGCEWKQSSVTNSPGDYTAFGRNTLNFDVRPAGCFLDVAHDIDGHHYDKNTVAYTGIWAFFWSSTRFHKKSADGVTNDLTYMHPDSIAAYNYDITYDEPGIARDVNGKDHQIGRSVRCVRDVSSMKVRINSKAETTSTSYTITGEVYDLGSTTCAERGVCYATHTYPSVSDTKVIATGTSGTYTCVVPVTSGVKYYVRAYAKDAAGNYVYSNEEVTVPDVCPSATVTDADNQSYYTKAYGSKCWTTSSLRTTKYANGDAIDFGSPTDGDLFSPTTGYYYTPYTNRGTLPGDYEARPGVWGYLYNWAAANDSRGICPTGWHVATLQDWTDLDNEVKGVSGCNSGSARALASKNTWSNIVSQGPPVVYVTNQCAPGYAVSSNNASGFGAYPVGIYNPNEGYRLERQYVNFWTSTGDYYTALGQDSHVLNSGNNTNDGKTRQYAFSIRCVKN